MQSVTFRILAAAYIFAAFYSSPATAKIYWLPDFLGSNTERSSAAGKDMDTSGGVSWGCARWGMLSLAQIRARGLQPGDCSTHRFPGVGDCYDNCRCSDDFPYTSCPAGSFLSGSTCNDGTMHYSECTTSCDSFTDHDCGGFGCRKTYADCADKCEICYTDNCRNREDNSSESGCQKYWDDCVSKCEIPYTDNCRNRQDNTTSYGCQKYWNDCGSKCETPYTDNCRNRQDNTTDYGCQKYWQDCPTKCEVGKTCIPTDCSGFTLSAAPANASYQECTPGCGNNNRRYRIDSCNSGYELKNGVCTLAACTSEVSVATAAELIDAVQRDCPIISLSAKIDLPDDTVLSMKTGQTIQKQSIFCHSGCQINMADESTLKDIVVEIQRPATAAVYYGGDYGSGSDQSYFENVSVFVSLPVSAVYVDSGKNLYLKGMKNSIHGKSIVSGGSVTGDSEVNMSGGFSKGSLMTLLDGGEWTQNGLLTISANSDVKAILIAGGNLYINGTANISASGGTALALEQSGWLEVGGTLNVETADLCLQLSDDSYIDLIFGSAELVSCNKYIPCDILFSSAYTDEQFLDNLYHDGGSGEAIWYDLCYN